MDAKDQTPTRTEREQIRVEGDVLRAFAQVGYDITTKSYEYYVELAREKHVSFAMNGLTRLPRKTATLSSGQPWLLFWITNTLELLGEQVQHENKLKVVEYLKACSCRD